MMFKRALDHCFSLCFIAFGSVVFFVITKDFRPCLDVLKVIVLGTRILTTSSSTSSSIHLHNKKGGGMSQKGDG